MKNIFAKVRTWINFERIPGHWWLYLGSRVVYGKDTSRHWKSYAERAGVRRAFSVGRWFFGTYRI